MSRVSTHTSTASFLDGSKEQKLKNESLLTSIGLFRPEKKAPNEPFHLPSAHRRARRTVSIMTIHPTEMCKELSKKETEITSAIERLIKPQAQIQEKILKLQRSRKKGEPVDAKLLSELETIREQSSWEIGHLTIERNDIYDDLPAVKMPDGQFEVMCKLIENDTRLIEQTLKKIEDLQVTITKAERLIDKLNSLVNGN